MGTIGNFVILGVEDEATLKLVARLMGGASSEQMRTLRVEALPDKLPLDLPLPEGAVVVGSVEHEAGQTRIILDVPLPAKEVIGFYTEKLQAQGFAKSSPNWGGFMDRHEIDLARGDELLVEVEALDVEGRPTAVWLLLRRGLEGSRYMPIGASGRSQRMGHPLPPLVLPSKTKIIRGAGTWSSDGDGGAQAIVDLSSELNPSELFAHYAAQFEEAGWHRIAGEYNARGSWSIWTVIDANGNNATGMLVFLADPTVPKQVFGMLRLERQQQSPEVAES